MSALDNVIEQHTALTGSSNTEARAELAALRATVAAQAEQLRLHTMRINGVIRFMNDGGETWEHVIKSDDEEEARCKFCGYEWPCRYEITRRALVGEDDNDMIACGVQSDKLEPAANPAAPKL